MRYLFKSICFISATIILLCASPLDKTRWKGKIEYEDGVKVIKNPAEPFYGEIEFDLEEDLSVGDGEEDKCYFYGSIDIDVDKNGNIYVLDRANFRVQKFDKNGNFVLTMGRQGQGPGEFRNPRELTIDRSNQISILDTRMIHIFNANGELEDCIGLKNICSQFSFTEKENIVCLLSTRTDEGREEKIILSNREGNQLTSYAKSILPVFRRKNMIMTGGGTYDPRLQFCPWHKGSAIYGHSSEYRIHYIDSSGELTFIAEIEKPPDAITKKEKNEFYNNRLKSLKNIQSRLPDSEPLSMNEIKKAYPLPENKPFFLKLFSDDEGNIYVFDIPDLYAKEKRIEFDFLNSQGYYLYRVKMALLPRAIKAGHIYRDIWDKEGEFFRVKRYKIKNWDQIETNI